jgi:hypothetical protein
MLTIFRIEVNVTFLGKRFDLVWLAGCLDL